MRYAVTGSTLYRPGLESLITDASKGIFDCVVLTDYDRFSRADELDSLIILRDLTEHVQVWTADAKCLELDSTEGKLLGMVKAIASRDEHRKFRDRVKRAFDQRVAEGYVVGNKIFGYDNVGPAKIKKRVPNADAETVREIFRRYLGGEGLKLLGPESPGCSGTHPPRVVRGDASRCSPT